MWFKRTGIAALVFLASASPGAAEDVWRRVAAEGLRELQEAGESRQGVARAAALHGDHIYVGTDYRDTAGAQSARVLRATIRDDDVWSDVTPSWGASEIARMIGFRGGLLVATVDDGLWQFGRTGWSQILPHSAGAPIRSVAALEAPDGHLLCVVRGSLQLRCNVAAVSTGWRTFTLPAALASDATIGVAQLHGFGGRLYVGVGGSSAGSRDCAVWASAVVEVTATARWGSSWSPLTLDCFGTHNTWVTSMAVFAGALYVGIGGHEEGVGVYKTAGAGYENATPPSRATLVPRYGAMATAVGFPIPASRLYVGRHIADPGWGTEVLARRRDGSWIESNEAGFGNPNNVSTSAMAGSDAYLYAGTLNLVDGFEVWRRVPSLLELLPPIDDDYRTIAREAARLRVCVPVPIPCPFELEPVIVPFEQIRLAFDKADHPDDDAQVIAAVRALMDEAAADLEQAGKLSKLIPFAESRKQAQELGRQLMLHVEGAVKTTAFAIDLSRSSIGSKTLK